MPELIETTVSLVRKRNCGAIFIVEMMILPRQARDKHRESTQKIMAFSYRIGRQHRRPRCKTFNVSSW
eukprot:COSAG06_NODE_24269_length_667_cov_2.982394_1_plen_67_part_10